MGDSLEGDKECLGIFFSLVGERVGERVGDVTGEAVGDRVRECTNDEAYMGEANVLCVGDTLWRRSLSCSGNGKPV